MRSANGICKLCFVSQGYLACRDPDPFVTLVESPRVSQQCLDLLMEDISQHFPIDMVD